MFKFVKIPCDNSEPVIELEGPKDGGLGDDYLIKYARREFGNSTTENGGLAANIDNLSPEDRSRLAESVRRQMESQHGSKLTNNMHMMPDETVLQLYQAASTQQSQCDITVVTVPTAGNGYEAVSMYSNNDSVPNSQQPINERAMELLEACGHATPQQPIRGDAFVGRCHDNEAAGTEWLRMDFTPAEIETSSAWIKIAQQSGGGGGSKKGASAPSLGRLLGQQSVADTASPAYEQEVSTGQNTFIWSQQEDEVEVKFQLEPTVDSKKILVNFSRQGLSVTVAGSTLLPKSVLAGPIEVDECTFTIQKSSKSAELCITLYKAKASSIMWPSLITNTISN